MAAKLSTNHNLEPCCSLRLKVQQNAFGLLILIDMWPILLDTLVIPFIIDSLQECRHATTT